MARVIDAETDALILRLIAEGKSPVAISHEARCGAETVRKRVARWRLEQKLAVVEKPPEAVVVAAEPEPEPEPETKQKEWVQEGGKARGEWITQEFVDSDADAIRVCKIDTTRWRVVRMRVKPYQVGMKLAEKEVSETGVVRKIREVPHRIQLFSISLDLELILPEPLLDAIEAVFARHAEQAPVYHPAPHIGGEVLLHFDLFDVHFGKLAWRGETGQDYDLRIAEAVFANAIDDLIEEAMGRRVDRIIIPFGNDFTHTDSGQPRTTLGTPVDTDGRRDKIYEVALMAFIRGVEKARQVAPVEIIRIPGNHDEDTSLGMSWAIRMRFCNAPDVTVDVTPGPRKYRLYGRTLFGYQHGNYLSDAKVKELPGVMLQEAPRDMQGAAEFHEWIIGHHHRERKFMTRDIDTNIGTSVRYMHSLSATDAWHHSNGFIGARRAAEVYRHHRDVGYLGHALALARV